MRKNFIKTIGGRMMKMVAIGALMVSSAIQSRAQVTVTATAGTLGPTVYTQLRLAFNAINAGTHQGAVTISITANTAETAVAQLNAPPAPGYTSVLIKPAPATSPVITGAINNNGVIFLRSATNVTIDGSNTVGGTSRNLTIRNTLAGTNAAIRFGSASAASGATNNIVKNCIAQCAGSTTGIAITSGSGAAIFGIAEGPNSNNTIQNNALSNAQTGVYAYGPAGTYDANWNITGNDISGTGFSGVHVNYGTGTSITDNTINAVTINGGSPVTGISLSFDAVNTTIARNKISNISNVAPNGAYGVYVDVNAVSNNVRIYNNFVLNPSCPASGNLWGNAHGIYTDFGNGISIDHNTVQLATNSGAAAFNSAVCFDPFVGGLGAGSVNMRDNIISNSQTTGNRYGVYCTVAPTIFATNDYNDYISNSGILGFVGGANRNTIAQMQAGFGGNVNSISFTPLFVSAADLHLQQLLTNAPLAAGVPIVTPLINTDIDNLGRNLARPTIGAHELTNRIQYTALTNSCSDVAVTLNPVTIESPLGIVTAGALAPRIYFRKGLGTWFSSPGTLVSGTPNNSTWSFVITAATMGGVVAGDVIYYYVIGQTSVGSFVFSNPLTGLVASDVNTVTTHPTTPNSFTIDAVKLNGLSPSQSVCYSTTAQVAGYTFGSAAGSPSQYTLTWSPTGPTDVTAFTAFAGSPINVTVPPLTAIGTYTGTLTVRNPTTTCANVYTVSLTVNNSPSIIGSTSVCLGGSSVLSGSPAGGTWSSTNTSVGTIGGVSGVVTGVGLGTSTIIYTEPTMGCTGTVNILVSSPPAPVTGTGSMCPGASVTLSTASSGGVWSSQTPVIASVDPATGVVTGGATGTTIISYTVTGCLPTTKTVTVLPIPNPITGFLYACIGGTTTLSSSTPGGTWISDSTSIATVDAATGVVTGVGYPTVGGLAPIKYKLTSTGCYVTTTVNVNPLPGPIVGGPLICEGDTIALTNSVAGGTWSSTLPGIVYVDLMTGQASANSPSGTTTITYTLGTSCAVTKVLTVSTAPTAITGSTQFLCSGHTLALGNGTPGGTWSSSNLAVGTVSATGVVYGVSGGVTNISYITTACSSVGYTVTVNQTPKPITGGITICNGASVTTITDSTSGGIFTMTGDPGATISGTTISGGLSTASLAGLSVGGTYVTTYTMPNACYVTAPIIVDTLPAPIAGPDSVCMGATGVMMTASTGGLWSSSNSSIASIVAATGVVTGVNHGLATITYAAISGCNRTKMFRVRNPLPASVSITRTPDIDTLCAGTPVTFTVHTVNGGATPGFQWQLFGVNVFAGDSVYTYAPTHGDVISCFMTYSSDVCSYPSPAYANIPINVYPNVAPVVTISTTSPNTVGFLGQVVTFFAEVSTAGGSPAYQWTVDGDAIPGATNSTFAHPVYDNDTVRCLVNGTPACETGTIGGSNAIVIYGDYLNVSDMDVTGVALSLYPNPNTGTFTLNGTVTSFNDKAIAVEVVNVLGQVVYTGSAEVKNGRVNQTISLGNALSAGTYVLRVNTGTENKIFHFIIAD